MFMGFISIYQVYIRRCACHFASLSPFLLPSGLWASRLALGTFSLHLLVGVTTAPLTLCCGAPAPCLRDIWSTSWCPLLVACHSFCKNGISVADCGGTRIVSEQHIVPPQIRVVTRLSRPKAHKD
eukprot:TRINITY_DN3534_c0_g1_i30.p1 TRINITY_DN3534_c0_g1~~TRINITY_DN3534_c0_g1_i30.p1  ORF type:complete len:125 (-),score=0.59 TRINITY_DN3534_c0_g1_i30:161-535(-)